MAGTSTIASNLQQIRAEMDAACQRAGRNPSEVTLVAVTKQRSLEEMQAVLDAGYLNLGENRIEEAEPKITHFAGRSDIQWHMIGHVQSRKAKGAVSLFQTIHSLESLKLARRYHEFAVELDKRPQVLLEINISGEESKSGIPAQGWLDSTTVRQEVWSFVTALQEWTHLEIRGLMTMAPFIEDEAIIRRCFADLRQLRDALANDFPMFSWHDLSMGMSHDYPIAIEEGATLVRVGTAIFKEQDE
jgi:PLP dependent protein